MKQQTYREQERLKLKNLIYNTNLFNGAEFGRIIKQKGKNLRKDEILLDGNNNIYESIRNDVLEYFQKNHISFWHNASESKDNPTGHTLSSQVCCINHLFPIRQDKKTVLSIANIFCPDIIDILPIPTDKYLEGYIQFEAVSDKNYLNESYKTRGSNCTSIDALIYGMHSNGKKYIMLVEWKYTEYYYNQDKSIEPKRTESKGKKRLRRYADLIDKSQYLNALSNYRSSVYFFEPFYQLMRQTLWAEQMINHNDTETIKADDYMHIHIVPSANVQLLDKVYKPSGKNMKETWLNCLKYKEKYKIIDPKDLLKNMDERKHGALIEYLNERYWR
ncbi:MAG: hypothetical protein LBH25_00870 [Fibromonadaceae bacterium]|jgi:hypothetical protein|nr:hypothetical protein [Fibromonadaceae bacterium]